MKFVEIVYYFEAGEDMKATEWIYIKEDPIIMRCDINHPDIDGVVAYEYGKPNFIKGEAVPVHLIIKEGCKLKNKITCPTCGGKGFIDE